MLHKPLIGDELTDDALYRSGLSNGVEMEANAMAADILMPRAEVLRFKRDRDMTSTSMAEKFDVSQSAMDIRLGVPSEQ
jgi:Zn-dependent peptidase ImmA (M78 family)